MHFNTEITELKLHRAAQRNAAFDLYFLRVLCAVFLRVLCVKKRPRSRQWVEMTILFYLFSTSYLAP